MGLINIVHNADCLPAMRKMKDNQFDLAIVDPPYGIGNFLSSNSPHNSPDWNYKIPDRTYFIELKRISKEQIIWGANYYNCFNNVGGALVWYKGNQTETVSHCEIASLSFQKKVDYCHINWQSGFYRKSIEDIIHACQKPIKLYKWLLKNYAKESKCVICKGKGGHTNNEGIWPCEDCNGSGTIRDTILDTHVGSGSSRIACWEMGFDFVGFETDVDYWKAQEKRFKIVKNQMKLF